MSKASEWADIVRKTGSAAAALTIENGLTFTRKSGMTANALVFPSGVGVAIHSSPIFRHNKAAVLMSEDALTLARWILDTFGEASA